MIKVKKDIYIIKNTINEKIYIGQSIDTKSRFTSHCKNKKDHSLIDMSIQKHGKQYFYFEVLESQIENYNEREKYWIKFYNSITPNGYNILPGGEEPPTFYGDDHPNTKIKEKEVLSLKEDLRKTKIPLSELGEKYGISKKQILRINQGLSRSIIGETYPVRANPNINGKLTEKNVKEIIFLLKYSYRFNGEIARQYGVEVHAISKINNGDLHRDNNEEYPIRKWKSCGVVLLTYDQVTEIIYLLKDTKQSITSIAKQYNVNRTLINNIASGNSKKYKRGYLQYPLRKH